MRLFLVRHAEARPQAENERDEDRPLTDHGREQSRALAAAFGVRGVALDAIVTSPLVRTVQTTSELAEGLKPTTPKVIENELLEPGELKPRKLSKRIAGLGLESVALVGHMPDLGTYAEWLIGAKDGSLPLAKAAAVCLEFDDGPRKGEGELLWLVTPEWFLPPVKAAAAESTEA